MRISAQLLDAIFSRGVDGRNSNAYKPVADWLEQSVSIGMGEQTISLNMLYRVLRRQSKFWEKEIDSWSNNDN